MRSDSSCPAWPSAVGGVKPGSSAIGTTATGSPSWPAAGAQPDPRVTATSCSSTPVRSRMAAAASCATASGVVTVRQLSRRTGPCPWSEILRGCPPPPRRQASKTPSSDAVAIWSSSRTAFTPSRNSRSPNTAAAPRRRRWSPNSDSRSRRLPAGWTPRFGPTTAAAHWSSASAPSTTRCPASDMPAATTSSRHPRSAPRWRWPRWPTSSG